MMAAQVLLQQQAVNAQTVGAIAPFMMQQRVQPNPWQQLRASPVIPLPNQVTNTNCYTLAGQLQCNSQ